MSGLPQEDVDVALLRRASAGDRQAFHELVGRHHDAVFAFVRHRVRETADAEDVLQQTFISAHRAAGQFRGDSGVRTWLLAIARRAALGLPSQRAARLEQKLASEAPESLVEAGALAGWGVEQPDELKSLVERHSLVHRALATLSHDERELLLLRDFEELSAAEACEALGLELAAQKSRLHRARLHLAAALRGAHRDGI